MNNENKYFEEIQEKTKEIIKSNDEKLNSFELKEGMGFIDKNGDERTLLKIEKSYSGHKLYVFGYDRLDRRIGYFVDEIDWEETRKLNEVKEQPKQEKYIIWNPKGCNPKKIHETLKSAEKEAERLALSQPNEDFYVLEVVKKVRGSVSIVWE